MKSLYFTLAALVSAPLILANVTIAEGKPAGGGHAGGGHGGHGHASSGHGKSGHGHGGHNGGHNNGGHNNGGRHHGGQLHNGGAHSGGNGQRQVPRIGQRAGRNPAAQAHAPRTFTGIQTHWRRHFSHRYNCFLYYDSDYDSFYFLNDNCRCCGRSECYSLLDESCDCDD